MDKTLQLKYLKRHYKRINNQRSGFKTWLDEAAELVGEAFGEDSSETKNFNKLATSFQADYLNASDLEKSEAVNSHYVKVSRHFSDLILRLEHAIQKEEKEKEENELKERKKAGRLALTPSAQQPQPEPQPTLQPVPEPKVEKAPAEKRQHWWNNGWLIGIGTTVLGAIALRLVDRVWETNILSSIWKFITSTYPTPLWILFLGGGLFIYLVFRYLVRTVDKKMNKRTMAPFMAYTMDDFNMGIVFKWEYVVKDGELEIASVQQYCPKDNCLLISGHCPICDGFYTSAAIPQVKVKVLIKQKIDNNLWPEVVARYQGNKLKI